MTLTPEQAVARLVDILAARAEFTEAEVYAALTESCSVESISWLRASNVA